MLTAVLSFVGVSLLGFALDWLVCTRIAAYRTDYEYSYRPRTVRYALIVLAAAVFAFLQSTYDPARQPIVGLLILGGILLAWGQVATRDVRRELVRADEAPKRYADKDY
jgi:hypothetical protein